MDSANLLFNTIYCVAILGWLSLWFLAKGYVAMRANRFLWIPFLYVIFIFAAQIALWSGRLQIVDFEIEQALLQVVEANSQKLIQAILGSLIIASILISLRREAVHPSRADAPLPPGPGWGAPQLCA